MAWLLDYFISSGGVLLVFFAGALWIACRPRSSSARRLVLSAAILYVVAGTYAVPGALGDLWASGYRRFETSVVSAQPTAIVLLGAGAETVSGWTDRLTVLNPVAAARVLEAWRVYQLIAPGWIVSSGGSFAVRTDPSIVMRDALVTLGVPASRVLLESTSLDTHDEAVRIAPMLRAQGVEQVVLVTSTVHMPRALGAFRAAGMQAVPAIAPDPFSFSPWSARYRPSERGLEMTSQLAHEVVGLPYYWWRGWWRR